MDKTKKLTVIFIGVLAYEIDAISGATITSNGMKDAVARCLEQASNF